MLYRIMKSEWLKVGRSSIWFPVLLAPFLAVMIGILTAHHGASASSGHQVSWKAYYFNTVAVYALLLLPLLTGVLASLMCRFEHLSGGWKQVLAAPVLRTAVYASKFIYVLGLLGVAQLLMLAGVLATGLIMLHIANPIPWSTLLRSVLGGWLALIPLAALQLWVSTWWKSFGAPFTLNVILTIPAVAVAHSERYGPVYPWAQPMLAMLPTDHGFLSVTPETSATIIISGVVLIVGGWWHFSKRDMSV